MGSVIKNIEKLFKQPDKKKLVENAVIVVIIGIILIIAGGSIFGGGNSAKEGAAVDDSTGKSSVKALASQDGYDVEKQLEQILSQIQGAGKVDVMLTYASSKESIPAYDEKKNESSTQEKDSAGGTRNTTQNDYESNIIYEEPQSGVKKPFIAKEILPQVKGVVIVAEGAADATVRESLCRAVQALTDVPVYKIQVFSMKGK